MSRGIENTVPAYKEKARLSDCGLWPARDDIGKGFGQSHLIEE